MLACTVQARTHAGTRPRPRPGRRQRPFPPRAPLLRKRRPTRRPSRDLAPCPRNAQRVTARTDRAGDSSRLGSQASTRILGRRTRLFHLSLFLTAYRLTQDPCTRRTSRGQPLGLGSRGRCLQRHRHWRSVVVAASAAAAAQQRDGSAQRAQLRRLGRQRARISTRILG